MSAKDAVFKHSPHCLQNIAITLFNTYQYKVRHGGKYQEFREYYNDIEGLNEAELLTEINVKKNDFLTYIKKNSPWYKNYNFDDFDSISVLEKADIVNNLNLIKTLDEKKGIVSLTGGTTGASMKVIYSKNDIQERNAILDHFRSQHGYELGKKTAWFSGKNLITDKDIKDDICSHYDFINKIRFYSTFKINEKNFEVYWKSLNEFQPEFLVGFPSSIFEICQIAKHRKLKYIGNVKVFFPTAETVLEEHRQVISEIFGCKLVDQYASSEGAPFILECNQGNLHIHPLTGIFEVVDDKLNPAKSGQMLVTSFTSHGTPLVRYRIGDSMTLKDLKEKCLCGSVFPLVERIEGRTNDFILSPEYGKVNLGNLSNSTKNIKGIVCFQLIQDTVDHIDIKVVNNENFSTSQAANFISAIRDRVGNSIIIDLHYVDSIEKEKSGKFRIVKNMLLVTK